MDSSYSLVGAKSQIFYLIMKLNFINNQILLHLFLSLLQRCLIGVWHLVLFNHVPESQLHSVGLDLVTFVSSFFLALSISPLMLLKPSDVLFWLTTGSYI